MEITLYLVNIKKLKEMYLFYVSKLRKINY